jgi:hypothetical protein
VTGWNGFSVLCCMNAGCPNAFRAIYMQDFAANHVPVKSGLSILTEIGYAGSCLKTLLM